MRKMQQKVWTYVRAKQTYDEVVVSSRAVPINKKEQNILTDFKITI